LNSETEMHLESFSADSDVAANAISGINAATNTVERNFIIRPFLKKPHPRRRDCVNGEGDGVKQEVYKIILIVSSSLA